MYTEANQNRAVAGSMTGVKVADKPRLSMQIDQLNKVLAECHHNAENLEHVADRILGPVPQDASKDGVSASPDTIERRLAEAIGYAETLARRLQHAASRLDSAA